MPSDTALLSDAFHLGCKKMPLTADEANQAQELLRWLVRDRVRLLRLSRWRREQMGDLATVVMDG